jgi:hypothetical protein
MLKALRRNYSGVDIIVPRDRTPAPDRVRLWNFVEKHYRHFHPQYEILEGRCPQPMWVKGSAILDGLQRSRAEIIVIADADCLVDPAALEQAIQSVRDGAAWAMPHDLVYRADALQTAKIMLTDPTVMPLLPDRHSVAREPYTGASGGGIVVMRRVDYDAVGGIPMAFNGWGSEDKALALLNETLLGQCVRGTADLLHLFHAPQPTKKSPQANVLLLRKLGYAALQGKDHLTATLFTMNGERTTRSVSPGLHRRAATPSKNIDLGAVRTRRDQLAQKRRPL